MHKYLLRNSHVNRVKKAKEFQKSLKLTDKKTVSDSFKIYINNIIPKMEEKVENNILNKLYNKLDSPLL